MIFLTSDGSVFDYDESKDVWTDGHLVLRPNENNWPCLINDGILVEVEGHMINQHGADEHLNKDHEIPYFQSALLHFFFTLLYPFVWMTSKIHMFRIERDLNRARKAIRKGNMEMGAHFLEKSLMLMGVVPIKYRDTRKRVHEQEASQEEAGKEDNPSN